MDSFDDCSESVHPMEFPKQYCILNVNVIARDNEKVFKDIKRFSSSKKFHFDHTKLKYGVCMSQCLNVHAVLKDTFKDYLNDKTSPAGLMIPEARKVMLNKLSNVCINKELIDYHGVMAETSIDYCIYDEKIENPLDRLFVVSIFGLIFILSISAVYEVYRKRPTVIKKLENWRRLRRYLNAYSIKKNWQALIGNNFVNIELDNELQIVRLYDVKLIMPFLFIVNQVYRQITSMPFANPIYVERVLII